MCVKKAVGLHCPNHPDDVKIVQIMITLNLYRLPPFPFLPFDGKFSSNLGSMIEMFQRRVCNMMKADGRVDPTGATLKALRAGIVSVMSDIKMQGVLLHAPAAAITKFYSGLVSSMSAIGINTPLRTAHFLAQIGHESADLKYTEEIASGAQYEGRLDLGNTQPGDGVRFKGRGLIQLTGRDNYKAYGDDRGKDYTVNNNWTKIATDPTLAVDVAAYFWEKNGLNSLADHDNVEQITVKINGGMNGLLDRKHRLALAKCFLLPS